MRLRRGGPDDAAAVLALFDEAVAVDGRAPGQVFVMRLGHQPGTAAR